jgi:hypothetical protein
MEAMSSTRRRLSRRTSGTSRETMRRASPSTMAVLPTPGSPMRTGLFFVRRARIWITLRISRSRPMTGSMLSSATMAVRSREYSSRRGVLADWAEPFLRGDSALLGSWRSPAGAREERRRSELRPARLRKASKMLPSSLAAASTICSVPMNSVSRLRASSAAASSRALTRREGGTSPMAKAPLRGGMDFSSSISAVTGSTSADRSKRHPAPLPSLKMAMSTCSGMSWSA